MIKKVIKNNFPIILLVLFSIFVYSKWFSFKIFTNSDWGFSFAENMASKTSISSWITNSNFGMFEILLWRTPIYYLYGVFGELGYGTNVSEKILVFWPTLIIANVASFLLVKKITKSNIAGVTGAIVFNYNTYIFVANTAFLLYSAAAWTLVSLYIFIHAMEKRRLSLFLLSGIALFITGSYDFRIAYLTIFLLIFYFVFYNLFIIRFNKKVLIRLLLLFTLQGVVFILLNLYWILASLASEALVTNSILSRGLFGNEFLNILYAFSFHHPYWTGDNPAIFQSQNIKIYFWLIPLTAFTGLILNKKNKNIIFFGLISLIGILLTKQIGIPFKGFYSWLFEYLPGFSAFREAAKFYFVISIGYSVLIGSFVMWIMKLKDNKNIYKYVSFFSTGFIIVLLSLPSIPVLKGSIVNMYTPRQIPADYLRFRDYLLKEDEFSRVFWIPAYSRWGIATDNHPQINGFDAVISTWNTFVKKYQKPGIDYQGDIIPTLLNEKYANNLLDISSIKYLVVPLEDNENEDNFFVFYRENRQYYIDELNKLEYLSKKDMNLDNLVVYENLDARSHIYVTDEKETIYKNVLYWQVNYKKYEPYHYEVNLENIKGKVYLNFAEQFNAGWKIRVGEFNWFHALYIKDYFIDDKYHFNNSALLNSYQIDPEAICNIHLCTVNSDGSYNIKINLFFVPQIYLQLGLVIFVITFSVSAIYIIFDFYRYTYEKNKKNTQK